MSITVGVVALPILLERLPGIHTRWALARAANAVELGDGNAEELLEKAAGSLPNPQAEVDYWNVRLKIAFCRDRQQVLQVLADALAADRQRTRHLFWLAFNHFDSTRDYFGAVQAMELYYGDSHKHKNRSDILNQFAYYRSLANVQLLDALDDIDRALELEPQSWQLLDTRAWVLYRLGMQEKALEDANKAVSLADSELQSDEENFWNRVFRWLNGSPEPASPDGLYVQAEVGGLKWSVAVIHYHRGKILESVGRADEAQQDWQWLRERRLPADERLH